VRILLVSQMFPGPDDPDLGVFVAQMANALADRGHDLDFAVLDRRAGGKRRFLELAAHVRRAQRPDVVWAHFLVPTGLIASRIEAPLVVTAHGRDVRNIGTIPGVRLATRHVIRHSSAVIAVSDYLRRELILRLPEASDKTVVINSGVDLARFSPGHSSQLDGLPRPIFLMVGSLSERKNALRLADAFAQHGEGSLVFVGDGPLRAALEGRPGVVVVGRVPHTEVPDYMRAADVICSPSLLEPFGQAVLEAMAIGKPVIATRFGGPPEFVPPQAGVLVDPLDTAALTRALASAGELPSPNLAGREAAIANDVNLQAQKVEAVLVRAVEGRQA
jgi:glycosyltransferase involved in cell wall biosynthesis